MLLPPFRSCFGEQDSELNIDCHVASIRYQQPTPSLPLLVAQRIPRTALSRTGRYKLYQLFAAEQDRVGPGDDGLSDGEM